LQLSTLLRLLDAMSAAKLNVLHWHIMDSYAFPFASELFPDLAAAGKWTAGNAAGQGKDSVYTHDMVRTVVQYATERGVRVIPEVDMPGHGYSWGLSGALSSITTACPGYTDELGHVDDVPLDPTKTLTYEVVLGLLSELTGLFPDTFLHLGGDEVKYGCWNESVSIKTWMIEHGLPSDDFYGLEQWFFKEVGSFTTEKLKRKVVAWEEVFFDDSVSMYIVTVYILFQ
jgi:hexosaminidase